MDLAAELKQLESKVLSDIAASNSSAVLQELRVQILGKKGQLTAVLRGMGALTTEERPKVGQLANEIRDRIEEALESRSNVLEQAELEARLANEKIDVTMPGTPVVLGHQHPLTRVSEEIMDIFMGLGFNIAEGPEVETDYYNFEALNLPKEHPARDMQDTFYVINDLVLRTQTSPVQVRTMEKLRPQVPVRIISPGKVYRRDDDATHSPMFQQVEGLVIDKGINLGHLKSTLLSFARQMYGSEREIRLRASYFPFTEPSAEVDVSCGTCGGEGCRVCKGTGWIEILGCGVVHPNVLKLSGYDPEEVSGFAFGMGVERIAMLKYGVEDLRHFFTNDYRFLKQF